MWFSNIIYNAPPELSLAKIALKVPPAGRNRSLVADTNMCGECVNKNQNGL